MTLLWQAGAALQCLEDRNHEGDALKNAASIFTLMVDIISSELSQFPVDNFGTIETPLQDAICGCLPLSVGWSSSEGWGSRF